MSSFHGGLDPYALEVKGIDPESVRDFSVSINPSPLPSEIQEIICHSAIYRYPDSRSRRLVDSISSEYTLESDEILVVNGTSQAIFLIAGEYLKNGDITLIAGPAYSEYKDACNVAGARVVEYRALEENAFQPDIHELAGMIEHLKPKLFWICSPNNPTGTLLSDSDVRFLSQTCISNNCLMILDEAYRCFTSPEKSLNSFFAGVVHLRSMTKDFCIPGLRLGWLRAEPDVVARLYRRQPEWSVSAPAQDAGTACLAMIEYFQKSWEDTRFITSNLADGLMQSGYEVFPTNANFSLVKIGDDSAVKQLTEFLWKRLILVRDCASFGLNGLVRIGTRSEGDSSYLLTALQDFNSRGY